MPGAALGIRIDGAHNLPHNLMENESLQKTMKILKIDGALCTSAPL